jgi:hypothetical protein
MNDTLNLLKVEAHAKATQLGHSLSTYRVVPFAPRVFAILQEYHVTECRHCKAEVVLKPQENSMGGRALSISCAVNAEFDAK